MDVVLSQLLPWLRHRQRGIAVRRLIHVMPAFFSHRLSTPSPDLIQQARAVSPRLIVFFFLHRKDYREIVVRCWPCELGGLVALNRRISVLDPGSGRVWWILTGRFRNLVTIFSANVLLSLLQSLDISLGGLRTESRTQKIEWAKTIPYYQIYMGLRPGTRKKRYALLDFMLCSWTSIKSIACTSWDPQGSFGWKTWDRILLH